MTPGGSVHIDMQFQYIMLLDSLYIDVQPADVASCLVICAVCVTSGHLIGQFDGLLQSVTSWGFLLILTSSLF